MESANLTLVVAFITAIFGPLIVERAKVYFKKKYDKKAPIQSYIEDGIIVKESMDAIKEELQADRVWITQFHNGSNFWPSQKSILKFSTTYETTSPGIKSRSNIFSNLPVSLFAKSLKELYDTKEILIPSYKIQDIETFGLEAFYHELEPKSTYIFALFNVQNQFIGTFGLEWVGNENRLNDSQVEYLRDKSISLGTLLGAYVSTQNEK